MARNQAALLNNCIGSTLILNDEYDDYVSDIFVVYVHLGVFTHLVALQMLGATQTWH